MDRFEQAKREYDRDGVARIAGVFDYEDICRMRSEAYMCLLNAHPKHPYCSGGRLQVSPQGSPALLFFPSIQNTFLNLIRCSKELVTIVHEFLGSEVKQLNNQMYYRMPNDGDAFAYHQDVMFRKAMTDNFDPADYLQTVICIDPMTRENGGISFVLGSHRCTDLDLCDKSRLRTPDGPPVIFDSPEAENPMPVVTIEAEPGDVLVWNALTVHGSGKNTSHMSRMTYMNGFCKASACEQWLPYPDLSIDTELIPYE